MLGNEILESLEIDADLFDITFTAENFLFIDPIEFNKTYSKASPQLIIAVVWFGFFALACIVGTVFELYN